ncbi:oligosaccharide flippase family protein [Pseudomonas sp. REP124]|uniref:oligosaccharide flippase family protein n=1 Tax=Pseudomonas sp. REP124 TaxID=2875731 RepID=UPI001CCEC826|nr:oligosaccharide flippase family protein [Pseudomonas sp. REP124]MBZ9782647.1 oligosaccharide flippase family protein [Pseudomonas sp. REP124]
MRFWKKMERYKASDFVRAVSVLIGGTAVAQIIMLCVLPLLTRLYTPEDFSVLSVYLALLSVISVAATLRFELAIPIPEDDVDAINVLFLAIVSSALSGTLIALVVYFFSEYLSLLFGRPNLQYYLWVLPVGIFFSGSYSALQFWTGRKKRFSDIAKTKVQQAFGAASVQILYGFFASTPLGLILGQTINNGAGAVGLAKKSYFLDKSSLSGVELHKMRRLFKKYDRFPKYSMLEGLANNAAIQVPVILIASLAAGPEAGYLLLAMQLMQAPIGLVGGAVSQVYLSKAPEMQRAGQLSNFTLDTLLGLVKVGIIPLVAAGAMAPFVFPIIFGEQWQRAGVIILYMVPWIAMQLLASPISMALHITNNQPIAMYLQFCGLLLRVGTVAITALWIPSKLTEVYAVTGFVFYTVYLIIVMNVTQVRIWDFLCRVKYIIGVAVALFLAAIMYVARLRFI